MHLEYLTNMGVGASLSFSILVKGQLWGLITCHQQSSKFTPLWQRQWGEVVVKSFANVILTSQEKRDYQQFEPYKRLEEALMGQAQQCRDIQEGLFHQPLNLLSITTGQGAAVWLDNRLVTVGSTPAENQILEIIDWLAQHNGNPLFYTQELSKHLPAASDYCQSCSGLLALGVSRYTREYLLFFKPQLQETRIWAGNPHKPLAVDAQRLHPRRSFAQWEEEIQGKSAPWTLNEREITQLLLKDIIALRLQQQAEVLQGKNTQLEDFTNIITHNLRSPMLSIGSLYKYYQRDPTPEKGATVMAHMKTVSDNMLTTISDLNEILQTKTEAPLPQQPVSLRAILEKEKQNLSALIEATQADIRLELGVPNLNIAKAYLESILHNLLSNALKYRSPNRRPSIVIKSWLEAEQACVSVSDNGLGLDLERVGSQIFGLYKTFHPHKEAKGLGLYLTKRQLEALGSSIEVASQPDQGTVFTLRFPTRQNVVSREGE